MMDTGTVRLVIFLGMFLAFAGDYSALISTIFGNAEVQNNKSEIASNRREGSAIEENNPERIVESAWIKSEDESGASRKAKMMATIKSACLPKLICELTSSMKHDQLSEMERSLLNLIRETSLNTVAEVPSRYHFAAHMGQLISGLEGQGCHNFYPNCPLPGTNVLNLMKKVRLR